MSKRVAVIDLGSNSVRMAIFERTSRLGFFPLKERKIKIRLASGAYDGSGEICEEALQASIKAFGEFNSIAKAFKASKILAVGTSALRDAPNAGLLIHRIKKLFGINLRVISGELEALYGGIAAVNLLSDFGEATTIDIGGGSTELAKIKDGKIIATMSLNLGTVRLKELFTDTDKNANSFIKKALNEIPSCFASPKIIAIGGSLRAISSAILARQKHPIPLIHAFSYPLKPNAAFIAGLSTASTAELKKMGIKKERYDTIKEGALIFSKLAAHLGAKSVATSGVGVREGVFLANLLRPTAKSYQLSSLNIRLPRDFNPSLRSIIDRFTHDHPTTSLAHIKKLFAILSPLHGLDEEHLNVLKAAAHLQIAGETIGFYSSSAHAAYLAINALNYGFSHEQKALIASILSPKTTDHLAGLLPPSRVVSWLRFILALASYLPQSAQYSLTTHADAAESVLLISASPVNSSKLSTPSPLSQIIFTD